MIYFIYMKQFFIDAGRQFKECFTLTKEKRNGLLFNLIVYLFAFGLSYIPYYFIKQEYFIEGLFIYSMSSVLIVYIVSLFIKNTSLFDPWWSVAPIVIFSIYMIRYNYWGNPMGVILFVLVCIWGIRLTYNWMKTYKGLDSKYEDWRYSDFRRFNPFAFHFINLFGFMVIPAICVYSASIPAFFIMKTPGFNPLFLIGVVIIILGPTLEFVADQQVHKFLKTNTEHNKTCNIGLWNYSRHPNYLGEVTFWVGIGVSLLLIDLSSYYVVFGTLLMPLLFLFISIPLMEGHNKKRRSDYMDYIHSTSVFLILPKKKKH